MDRVLANWYVYIYNALFSQTGTYDKLTTYSDAISSTLSPGGALYSVYIFVRTIAFGILTVYLVITLGTKLEGKEASPAVIFRTFLQFFVGYALAFFSFDIVCWIFKFGDALAEAIRDSSVTVSDDFIESTDTFIACLDSFSFTDKVFYLFKAALPYMVCLFCDIVISYTLITRCLRICVNAALSPIAVANFFEGTRRSDAVRFLKRTLAMGLQCATIMIITAGVSSVTGYLGSGSVYSNSLAAGNTVLDAQQEMIDSSSVNYDTVTKAINKAVDKKGGPDKVDSDYVYPIATLSTTTSKITRSLEADCKKAEDWLGIEIFVRDDNGNYVYALDEEDGKRYAKVSVKYKTFTVEATKNFMSALLGGSNYWIFILMLLVRTGLIKQSMAFANTVVGL